MSHPIFVATFHPLSPSNRRAIRQQLQMPSKDARFVPLQDIPVNEGLRSALLSTLYTIFSRYPEWMSARLTLVVADEGEQAIATLLQEYLYGLTGRFPDLLDLIVMHTQQGEFSHYELGTHFPSEEMMQVQLPLVIRERQAQHSEMYRIALGFLRFALEHVVQEIENKQPLYTGYVERTITQQSRETLAIFAQALDVMDTIPPEMSDAEVRQHLRRRDEEYHLLPQLKQERRKLYLALIVLNTASMQQEEHRCSEPNIHSETNEAVTEGEENGC